MDLSKVIGWGKRGKRGKVIEYQCDKKLVRQLQLHVHVPSFCHLPCKAITVKPSLTNHKGCSLLPLAPFGSARWRWSKRRERGKQVSGRGWETGRVGDNGECVLRETLVRGERNRVEQRRRGTSTEQTHKRTHTNADITSHHIDGDIDGDGDNERASERAAPTDRPTTNKRGQRGTRSRRRMRVELVKCGMPVQSREPGYRGIAANTQAPISDPAEAEARKFGTVQLVSPFFPSTTKNALLVLAPLHDHSHTVYHNVCRRGSRSVPRLGR